VAPQGGQRKPAAEVAAKRGPANQTVCLLTQTAGTGFTLPSEQPNPRLPGQAMLTPIVLKMLELIEKVLKQNFLIRLGSQYKLKESSSIKP